MFSRPQQKQERPALPLFSSETSDIKPMCDLKTAFFFFLIEVQRGSAVEIPKLNAPFPEKIIPSDGKVYGERMD